MSAGPDDLRPLLAQLGAPADPRLVLRRGIDLAAGEVALACSFAVEDTVLVHLLAEEQLLERVAVFALDTGRLPEETYEVAEHLSARYGVSVRWHHPEREAVERLLTLKGPLSFRQSLEDRHECCHLRKVEPLRRALQGKAGWITGMRREQSVTRAALQSVEWDQAHSPQALLKLNPLCDWDEAQLWAFARAQQVPHSRLYQRGYRSIGCAPCTRAVGEGEPARAGRWWWEDPEHKECGLHRPL